MSTLLSFANINYTDFVTLVEFYNKIGIVDAQIVTWDEIPEQFKGPLNAKLAEGILRLKGVPELTAAYNFHHLPIRFHWSITAQQIEVYRKSDESIVFLKTGPETINGVS